jgi:predicted TIM-barrel fold metal-dependent hydrolase
MATDNRPIDAHAHVSSPDGVKFPRSDALPAAPRFDVPIEMLLRDMDSATVGRGILIQPSLYGFDHSYLLDCLAEHPSRFAGVALADPADASFRRRLVQMAREAPIVGVRFAPLIDPSRPWFAAETDSLVKTIADLDMAVCLLVAPAHLERAAAWIGCHAGPRIVIDHLGRPDLGAEGPEAVCERVARLSEYENVWVKLSALTELSREPYPHRDTAVWARRMLAAFGPARLMWGSDFPFVAGAEQYSASLSSLREALGEASSEAYQQIVARTATEVFRLERTG